MGFSLSPFFFFFFFQPTVFPMTLVPFSCVNIQVHSTKHHSFWSNGTLCPCTSWLYTPVNNVHIRAFFLFFYGREKKGADSVIKWITTWIHNNPHTGKTALVNKIWFSSSSWCIPRAAAICMSAPFITNFALGEEWIDVGCCCCRTRSIIKNDRRVTLINGDVSSFSLSPFSPSYSERNSPQTWEGDMMMTLLPALRKHFYYYLSGYYLYLFRKEKEKKNKDFEK